MIITTSVEAINGNNKDHDPSPKSRGMTRKNDPQTNRQYFTTKRNLVGYPE